MIFLRGCKADTRQGSMGFEDVVDVEYCLLVPIKVLVTSPASQKH
jgi:hypothetical protein